MRFVNKMKRTLLLFVCICMLMCGCFAYSPSALYSEGETALCENRNAVRELDCLNEEEKVNFISAMESLNLPLDGVKDRRRAKKILDGYIISLRQIYTEAEEMCLKKRTAIQSYTQELSLSAEKICSLENLTATEKNLFADALFFADFNSLPAEELFAFESTVKGRIERIEKSATAFDSIRDGCVKKKEGLKENYALMLDEFLAKTYFPENIKDIEEIESFFIEVEKEYVSLIAYIEFKMEIEQKGYSV